MKLEYYTTQNYNGKVQGAAGYILLKHFGARYVPEWKEWRITHVPTGYLIARSRKATLHNVCELVNDLTRIKGVDWGNPRVQEIQSCAAMPKITEICLAWGDGPLC